MKFLWILLLPIFLWSTTYTVGSGKDYATIQAAINAIGGTITGGDSILIDAGTYNESPDIDDAGNYYGNPIIITVAGACTVNIQSGGAWQFTGSTDGIEIHGDNNLYVNGHSTILDDAGVFRYVQSGGSITGVVVKDLELNCNDTGASGFRLFGTDSCVIDNVTITGDYERGIEGSSDAQASAVGSWNLIIRNCSLAGGATGIAQIEASATDDWLIEKNYVYRNGAGSGNFLVQHRGGKGWQFINNVFHVGPSGTYTAAVILRDDTGYSGEDIENEIYMNNTFINEGTLNDGFIFWGWGGTHINCRIQNNLFLGDVQSTICENSGTPASGSGCNFNNNYKSDVSGTGDSNSDFGSHTISGWTFAGQDSGAITLHLAGNVPSPYYDIDASQDGSNANSPPSTDYDGNTRAATPDVGAFEDETQAATPSATDVNCVSVTAEAN